MHVRGVQDVRTLSLGRQELAAAWQLGIAPGVGGGLIHAPSLMAPSCGTTEPTTRTRSP
ncbi:hypothetical protein GCM10025863_14240 [Microbacterium suwonense]|uniref:Uncharacterized protein n=1 Tax=Microbacterium suwonense TaxID=683047 RepID=A0ABM8FT07_9MICO|nr:hypothetical protein GCM10025863_14240 [Microbacterium suwonense]